MVDSIESTSLTNCIDTHVHFWDPNKTPRAVTPLVKLFGFSPRLTDAVARLAFPTDALRFYGHPRYITRPYLPEDYKDDAREHHIAGVVHVEAGWICKTPMDAVNETKWLTSINNKLTVPIKAIVAHADLSIGRDVNEILDAHLQASNLVRGIRQVLLWHPDKNVHSLTDHGSVMEDAKWRSGFEQLSQHNLSFETVCYTDQLGMLSNLAEAYPETPITLCHLGMPIGFAGPFSKIGTTRQERVDIRQRWHESISRLATNPNVSIKLSGLGSPPLGFDFEHRRDELGVDEAVASYAPLINGAIDTFGAERCMIGSNFPVDKVSVSLAALFTAISAITAGRTEQERKYLFGDTARNVYRLDI